MAFGTAGSAQDKAEPKQEQQRIIIMEHRDGTASSSGRANGRVRIDREGSISSEGLPAEVAARLEGCRNGNQLTDIDDAQGNQRTRLMLCTNGDTDPADRVEALQRARERLAGSEDLSAEVKQRILSRLDQAIARARVN